MLGSKFEVRSDELLMLEDPGRGTYLLLSDGNQPFSKKPQLSRDLSSISDRDIANLLVTVAQTSGDYSQVFDQDQIKGFSCVQF